jgi:poly(U)-specific endoribonuclease
MFSNEYRLNVNPGIDIPSHPLPLDEFDFGVDLEVAIQEMWKLDENKLNPTVDYQINPDVNTSGKLFQEMTETEMALKKRPTFAKFVALLDNYETRRGKGSFKTKELIAMLETNTAEEVQRFLENQLLLETQTKGEEDEIDAFLSAIMETQPMQYCHRYLLEKRATRVTIPDDAEGFKKVLEHIWFGFHDRTKNTTKDAGEFEHVFVGERDNNGKVGGMHNWIQIYLQEKYKKVVDGIKYNNLDHLENIHFSDDCSMQLESNWKSVEEPECSVLLGTSPEFEMALYTTYFLLKNGSDLVLDKCGLNIINYKRSVITKDGKTDIYVATTYPTIKEIIVV